MLALARLLRVNIKQALSRCATEGLSISLTPGLRLKRLWEVFGVNTRFGALLQVNILRAAKYRLTSGRLR